MNIIEHLNHTVTPIVLNNITNENQQNLLEKAYAVMVSRLADDKQNLPNQKIDIDDTHFLATLLNDKEYQQIIQQFSQQYELSENQTEDLLKKSAPLVFNELYQLAGTTSLPVFLQQHLSSLVNVIPTWAYAFIPVGVLSNLNLGEIMGNVSDGVQNALSQVQDAMSHAKENLQETVDNLQEKASHLKDNVQDKMNDIKENLQDKITDVKTEVDEKVAEIKEKAHTIKDDVHDKTLDVKENAQHLADNMQQQVAENGGFLKALLPIIALTILAVLLWAMLKSCQTKPENYTAPPPSQTMSSAEPVDSLTNLKPALLALTTDADKKIDYCSANLGDTVLRAKINETIKQIFGKDKECEITVSKTYTNSMAVMDKLPEMLQRIQQVAHAKVSIDGQYILLSTPKNDETDKLVKEIQSLLPDDIKVIAEHSEQTINIQANQQESIDQKKTDNTEQAITVFEQGKLKLYFATGKAELAKDTVDKAQEIINLAKDGKKLGISGYTDSTGDVKANEKLSKKRAQAVETFLMAQGIDKAQIELVKPKDSVGAAGKDQEGRRVEVFVME